MSNLEGLSTGGARLPILERLAQGFSASNASVYDMTVSELKREIASLTARIQESISRGKRPSRDLMSLLEALEETVRKRGGARCPPGQFPMANNTCGKLK